MDDDNDETSTPSAEADSPAAPPPEASVAPQERIVEVKRGVSPTIIGFAVLAVFTLLFIVLNAHTTEIQILFYHQKMRVWAAILISIGLGVVLDRLFVSWWRRHRGQR